MSGYYEITVRPFDLGTTRDKQRKVVEEAAEAFAEAEDWRLSRSDDAAALLYECCDTIQAACNLMAAVGATQADVADAMDRVHRRNAERGRYGTTGPAR